MNDSEKQWQKCEVYNIDATDPRLKGIPQFPILYNSLKYPFNEHNGYVSWSTAKINEWSRKYIPEDNAWIGVKMNNFGGYGCAITYRGTSSKQRLFNLGKITAWALYSDTYLEGSPDEECGKQLIRDVKKTSMYLLNHDYDPNDAMIPDNPFIHMYCDAFQSMRDTGLTKFQQWRLVNSLSMFMDGNYDYIDKRGKNMDIHFDSIERYIVNRRPDIWIELMYLVGEYGMGIDTGEEVFNNGDFQECLLHGIDMLWIMNDLCSFAREITTDGACKNFVMVAAKEKNMSLQESHDYIVDMYKAIEKKFWAQLKKLQHSPLVRKYPDLAIWCKYNGPYTVYGQMQWSDVTGRYRINEQRCRREIENPILTIKEQIQLLGKTYFD